MRLIWSLCACAPAVRIRVALRRNGRSEAPLVPRPTGCHTEMLWSSPAPDCALRSSGPVQGNRPVETVPPEEEPARAQCAGKARRPAVGGPPRSGGVALGLTVHVGCGFLQGQTEFGEQRCRCSPALKWQRGDVPELRQLCPSCLSAPAGGPSRWSVLVCRRCWKENRAKYHLPLARHSIPNAILLEADAGSEEVARFQAEILGMVDIQRRLGEWRRVHLQRLLAHAGFEAVAEMPEDLVHLLARLYLPPPQEAILGLAAWLREGGSVPAGW